MTQPNAEKNEMPVTLNLSPAEWKLVLVAIVQWRDEYATAEEDAVLRALLARVTSPVEGD